MHSVSLRDGDKALQGALNLQTFYAVSRYSYDAKALVVASIPALDNSNAFDTVYFRLANSVSEEQIVLLYAADSAVGHSYANLYRSSSASSQLGNNPTSAFPKAFEKDLSKLAISVDEQDKARLRESELDSITASLVNFWQNPNHHWRMKQRLKRDDTTPAPDSCAHYNSTGLEGIVLKLDRDGADPGALDWPLGKSNMKDLDLSCSDMSHAYVSRADIAR